jgi:hypothetical protein
LDNDKCFADIALPSLGNDKWYNSTRVLSSPSPVIPFKHRFLHPRPGLETFFILCFDYEVDLLGYKPEIPFVIVAREPKSLGD